MTTAWFVAKTQVNRERTAEFNIKNQGYDVRLPLVAVPLSPYTSGGRERRGELVRHDPLFPSYVFVRFDPATHKRWRSLNSTRGVEYLLPHKCEDPTPVNGEWLDEIISRTKDGPITFEQAVALAYNYAPGDMVPILTGTARGQVAEFVARHRNSMELYLCLSIKGVGLMKVPARDCATRSQSEAI